MNWSDRLVRAGKRIQRWARPPRAQLPADVLGRLAGSHPEIPWARIRWRRGWPHVLGFSSYRAITLPDRWSRELVSVYLPADWWSDDGLERERLDEELLLHEGWHAAQVTAHRGGRGWGLIRPYTALYLAWWAKGRGAYRTHPMEVEAYAGSGERDRPFGGASLGEAAMAATPGASRDRAGLRDRVLATGWLGFWLLAVLLVQVTIVTVEQVGWTTGYLVRAAGRAGARLTG